MSESFDCVIAGAGVIGLAIGRRLALAGLEVAVVEAEDGIGIHTSSRNSEVIHAGLYYPKDSLKALFCVAGKEALYRYCEVKGIRHRRIGKIIVATEKAEESKLQGIERQARENGVSDLEFLTAGEISNLEPMVRASAALFSPSTGIVDSHEYMLALQADLEGMGGYVILHSRVSAVNVGSQGFEVVINNDSTNSVTARIFVNATGLWAPELTAAVRGEQASPQKPRFARGHYFSYSGPSPFNHLIYPVPVDGGLGIHATNDLAGAARFGPDVEWIDSIDYTFSPGLKEPFVDAIRRYFPTVESDRLNPSYTGIRPKLCAPGEPPADFAILGPTDHGVAGMVDLLGIESPGLTASLAIADYVHDLLLAA